MKLKLLINSLSCGALLLAGGISFAGDIYVISNSSVSLTAADVRDIFLGEKQVSGSIKLVPVDNESQQADFLEKAMKMEKNKYINVWVKKGFRDGLIAPQIKFNDDEIVKFVKNTPGAIGYIGAAPPGVNMVHKY